MNERILIVLSLALGATVHAQAPDFDAFHSEATAALGGDVGTLAFTGSGWDACLGQAWAVTDGWARWELTDYQRVIDYRAGTSTQSAMRRAGLYSERIGGCGAQVNAAAQRQQSSIGSTANFATRLPITLTPHGLLRLAAGGEPEIRLSASGWVLTLTVVSDAVTYTLMADYGADYLPRRIRTWIDDPIFGDMEVAAEFGAYRDFGGVNFPESLTLTQGGLATLMLTLDSVTPGVAEPEIPPARAFNGGATTEDPAFVEIGDGIFVILGAYQAVAVEFDEFAVVIDGMQNDSRTQEVIRLTHQAIPAKPIRYIVNTHSHFDHASGLRQFAAEGALVLTHEINVPFFSEALTAPRTLNPDITEPSRINLIIRGIAERFVIADDSGQRVELIPLQPNQHAADMLIAYLPTIKTIVEADLLQPWINPVFAGGNGPNPYLLYLFGELERVQPDYEQFVPIHTPPEPPLMPRSALSAAVGR